MVHAARVVGATVRDRDDDQVLACATAAQAQLIVSRDKDLLDLRQYQRIPILGLRRRSALPDIQQHNS